MTPRARQRQIYCELPRAIESPNVGHRPPGDRPNWNARVSASYLLARRRQPPCGELLTDLTGAGEGIRTLDPDLGKVVLPPVQHWQASEATAPFTFQSACCSTSARARSPRGESSRSACGRHVLVCVCSLANVGILLPTISCPMFCFPLPSSDAP